MMRPYETHPFDEDLYDDYNGPQDEYNPMSTGCAVALMLAVLAVCLLALEFRIMR